MLTSCRQHQVRLRHIVAGLACVLIGAFHATALANPSLPDSTLLGPTPRTATKLSQVVSVHWHDVPAGEAIAGLGQSQRLCIWLDRRIDPTSELTLSLRDKPLVDVVGQLADRLEAGAVASGDLVYVGPPDIVRDLRTLLVISRQCVQQLPRTVQQQMLLPTSLKFPRLTEPRNVVSQLGERVQMPIENLQLIPHDVWRGGELPSMPVADHLTIVLAAFDLAWQPSSDNRAIRIVGIDHPVAIRRMHRGAAVDQLATVTLAADAISPGPDDGQVWVMASVEVHEQIAGPTGSRTLRRPLRETKQVYSLRVDQQPVGKILEQLSRQLGKQLHVADGLSDLPVWDQRVSFTVQEADLNELLHAACQPAGLAVSIEGEAIRVFVAEN